MAYLSGWRGKGKHRVLAGRDLILLQSDAQHPPIASQYEAQHFAAPLSPDTVFGSTEFKYLFDISTR